MNSSPTLIAPASSIEVRALWAQRHDWRPGENLKQRTPRAALWLMLHGEARVRSMGSAMSGKEWHVGAGSAFLWQSGCDREITTSGGASWLTVGLEAIAFNRFDLLPLLPAPRLWTPTPAQRDTLQTLLELLVVNHAAPALTGASLVREGVGRTLFGLVWQELEGGDLNEAIRAVAPAWLERALHRCAQEPAPSVAELARLAALSPAQFRRSFRQWMGTTPRDHLHAARLELARRLLASSSESVAQVAARAGFDNASHFTRRFKAECGASPLAYRRAARERV